MGARSAMLAASLALAGCSLPYEWGAPLSLAPETPGALVATDCLDLRVVPEATVGRGQVRLAYAFGNRCDRPLRVDLAAAKVESDDGEGHRVPLARHVDPPPAPTYVRGLLDVRAHASATIRYDAADGACVRAVCVDLGAVAPGVTRAPACFAVAAPAPREGPAAEIVLPWDRDAVPAFFFELGAGRQPIPMRGRTIHDDAIGSFATDALGTLGSYTGNLRGGGRIVGPLYAGSELRIGGGSFGARRLQASPAVTLSGDVLDFGGRVFAGARSPRLGPLRAHAEAFVGVRFLDFAVDERFGCTHDGCAGLSRADVPVGGRAGLDVFVSPWWSLGAWASVDSRDPSPGFGFAIAFHAHGFE